EGYANTLLNCNNFLRESYWSIVIRSSGTLGSSAEHRLRPHRFNDLTIDFVLVMRYYNSRSQCSTCRCGGTVYAPVSKTGPERVEGSNLSIGTSPPQCNV